jgi:hypothetical protein
VVGRRGRRRRRSGQKPHVPVGQGPIGTQADSVGADDSDSDADDGDGDR